MKLTMTVTATLTAMLAAMPLPAAGPILTLTATTDNIAGAHDSIRIDLIRWSTDAERNQLLSAWTNPAPPPSAGRGGRGRGGAAAGPDPFAGGNETPAPAGAAGRGGRGGRGAAPAAPPTPEASLTTALGQVPTLGYLWSSEVAGYSLHYAVRLPEPDGGERIILITDRRLGADNDLWKPTGDGASGEPAPKYEFTLIELRLNAKGEGEGKISLPGKVGVDGTAKTIMLENYKVVPVVLKNVRHRSS
jgi:hypothetical protein